MVDALKSEVTDDQVIDPDEAVTAAESEGDGEGSPAPETDGFVIEESGAQPEKVATQAGVNRLLGKLGRTREAKRDIEKELETERQKRELLELALEQAREAEVQPPDPSTFDEGISDPKYVKEQTAYIATLAAKEVRKDLPKPTTVKSDNMGQKHREFAERATALGVDDYDSALDAATEVLGGQTVNELIRSSGRSEITLYYLGKNPDRAEYFRDLIATDAVTAILELGKLEARLEVKPKAKTQRAPDPDEEMPGSSPSGGQRRGPKGATFE